MTAPASKGTHKPKMLPYRKGGPIDYASLEFDPDVWEWPPDHMEQNKEIAAEASLEAERARNRQLEEELRRLRPDG